MIEPDVHGVLRAMLHELEDHPVLAGTIFRRWRREGEPRRKAKNRINRLLHELVELGFAEQEGGLWDSTELGRRALANARARKEPANDQSTAA